MPSVVSIGSTGIGSSSYLSVGHMSESRSYIIQNRDAQAWSDQAYRRWGGVAVLLSRMIAGSMAISVEGDQYFCAIEGGVRRTEMFETRHLD